MQAKASSLTQQLHGGCVEVQQPPVVQAAGVHKADCRGVGVSCAQQAATIILCCLLQGPAPLNLAHLWGATNDTVRVTHV